MNNTAYQVVTFTFTALAYLLLFAETYMYQGFVAKHFLIDAKITAIISIVLLVYYKYKLKTDNKNNLVELGIKLNNLLIIIFTVFYFGMQYLETVNYNNYVFSKYHLQPQNFLYLVLFSLGIFLVDLYSKGIKNKLLKELFGNYLNKGSTFISYLLNSLIFVLIIITFFTYTLTTFSTAFKSLSFIYKNIDYTYDDKMRHIWGFYYDYMKFVKENTPENASILIPPQESPWLSEGNVALSRYFVYPRRLYNGKLDEVDLENVDYIFLAWGSWKSPEESKYGWPKDEIEAEEIILFDADKKTITRYKENYDPNDGRYVNAYGIIKIKK